MKNDYTFTFNFPDEQCLMEFVTSLIFGWMAKETIKIIEEDDFEKLKEYEDPEAIELSEAFCDEFKSRFDIKKVAEKFTDGFIGEEIIPEAAKKEFIDSFKNTWVTEQVVGEFIKELDTINWEAVHNVAHAKGETLESCKEK